MGLNNSEKLDFARLLDKLLASDNPQVKETLRELMVIVALTETNSMAGPIETMFQTVDQLNKHIAELDIKVRTLLTEKTYTGITTSGTTSGSFTKFVSPSGITNPACWSIINTDNIV